MKKLFFNELGNKVDYTDNLIYSAGIIQKYNNEYIIVHYQAGAEETFSVGQPVYDKDGNTLGYLGIGLFENLDYSCDQRVPVEHWTICFPTEHCKEKAKVFTYWQNKGA